jgi:hypothetical protein
MNSITCINTLRDELRTHLVDPYTLTVPANTTRTGSQWIFADEPVSGARYPMIQLSKLNNPSIPITIGPEYWEHEQVLVNIWVYVKNGFQITVSGTNYVNASVVEYYLDKIKSTLKGQFSNMEDLGVGGFKVLNTTRVEYDPVTQLYFAAVSVRVWFFTTRI